MDRLACVDVPALPLQLLVRRNPSWAGLPTVVVDEDKPGGRVLWADEVARAGRILPGMRYAAALSLQGNLHAGVVGPREVEEGREVVAAVLRRFSPRVELSRHESGVAWLDASGLGTLYPSLSGWGRDIVDALRGRGLAAVVVVGFGRLRTYALTQVSRGVTVLESAGVEEEAARAVPLERLNFPAAARDTLLKLGVRTLGEFLRLPADGLLARLGAEVHALHRLGTGGLVVPLRPEPPPDPVVAEERLDLPETDTTRLLFLVKRLLHPLLGKLSSRGEALAGLTLLLRLQRDAPVEAEVRPAAPTLDAVILADLVRLKLEALKLGAGVTEVRVTVAGVVATAEQVGLLGGRPRRDLEAGNRALARLRAEWGDASVVRARLREAHLPEAQVAWEPVTSLEAPEPRRVAAPPLVRRVLGKPRPVPPPPLAGWRRGWLVHGAEAGPVVETVGPFVVAGGWWRRPVHRAYHYARLARGDWVWLYHDGVRRQWFLHGVVS
jgi:protein ImuB